MPRERSSAFADGMTQAPLAHVTLARALERLVATPRTAPPAPRVKAAPASQAVEATAVPPATATLEDEAYDAVEIDARLGSSEDDDWKPFRVELTVRKGWHVNANPAGSGPRPDRGDGRRRPGAQRPLPRGRDAGTAVAARCRSTAGGSRSRARSSAGAGAPPASRSATRPATTPGASRPSRGSCGCGSAPCGETASTRTASSSTSRSSSRRTATTWRWAARRASSARWSGAGASS